MTLLFLPACHAPSKLAFPQKTSYSGSQQFPPQIQMFFTKTTHDAYFPAFIFRIASFNYNFWPTSDTCHSTEKSIRMYEIKFHTSLVPFVWHRPNLRSEIRIDISKSNLKKIVIFTIKRIF